MPTISASSKQLRISGWRPVRNGARTGFLNANFSALHLSIDGISVFEKNGKAWAMPPSRPLLADGGSPLRDADAKSRWVPIIRSGNKIVRDASSCNVIDVLLAADPRALDREG